VSVGPDSRYNRSAILVVQDQFGRPQRKPYIDIFEPYSEINDPTNRRYVVNDIDRPHTLGYRFLGNSRHWWAVADFNEVIDPFEEFQPTAQIQLPSRGTFQFDVLDFDLVAERDIEDGEA